jgi:SAM-dependent methyltransferase
MPIFQCKQCHHRLPFTFRWEHKNDGTLQCPDCAFSLPLWQGIPIYLPEQDMDRVQEFQRIYKDSVACDPWDYDQSAAEHLRYNFLKTYIQKEFPQAKRVLDMGCSGGHLLEHLRDLPFEEYFAFDINLDAVAKAWNRASQSKIGEKRVTFFVANATDLPIEDNSFDLVLCVDGIIGWELSAAQKEKVFGEIRRVLRPNGSAIFVDYISKTRGAHLYPQVFSQLQLQHKETAAIHDRLSYEFESAIKGLQKFSLFQKWKRNLNFAIALSKLAPLFGKHGSKHLAYIASKVHVPMDKLALPFFLLSC